MEQLEELLHQFRRTPQTVSTLDSTHHAVVRSCISEGRSDNLMRMLDDPLNFGLFPDNYSLVFMLNHFLLAENWRDATKAIFVAFVAEDSLSSTLHRSFLCAGGDLHDAAGGAPGPLGVRDGPPRVLQVRRDWRAQSVGAPRAQERTGT